MVFFWGGGTMVISSSCSLTVSTDNFLHACVNATNAYKGPAATADTWLVPPIPVIASSSPGPWWPYRAESHSPWLTATTTPFRSCSAGLPHLHHHEIRPLPRALLTYLPLWFIISLTLSVLYFSLAFDCFLGVYHIELLSLSRKPYSFFLPFHN